MRLPLLILLCFSSLIYSVELPPNVENPPSSQEIVSSGNLKITQKNSQVSVLCYHDFSARYQATEMRIRKEVFSQQMKRLADSDINVISLKEFVAWKKGELELPPNNVLITIDDGWRSVYLVAYPVLKKHGYPFVLGIYKDFLNKGELSLNDKMVKEMMSNGMSLSSHSVTHPFPSAVRKMRSKSEAEYDDFLKLELGESRDFLQERFQQNIESYIFPGGYYTQEMFPALRSFGYEFAFTVKPGKVSRDSKDLELPRYVVLGTTDRIFEQALTFKSLEEVKSVTKLPHPVKPLPHEPTLDRLPWIGVDLSSVKGIDKESVYMRVSGFGLVKARFLKDTNRFEWQATRPLRQPSYNVLVQWKKEGEKKYEDALKWSFEVNQKPAYIKAGEVN